MPMSLNFADTVFGLASVEGTPVFLTDVVLLGFTGGLRNKANFCACLTRGEVWSWPFFCLFP